MLRKPVSQHPENMLRQSTHENKKGLEQTKNPMGRVGRGGLKIAGAEAAALAAMRMAMLWDQVPRAGARVPRA